MPSKIILDYFWGKTTENCGICSFCITSKKAKRKVLLISYSALEIEDLSSRGTTNLV
jgi:ATP-dependent DNA helicase RecQ